MSIASRPFLDPRNKYIIANDDAGAFDKRFRGQPGTHVEYRCCGDKAPYPYYKEWVARRWAPGQHRSAAENSLVVIKERIRREEGRDPDELICSRCSTALEDLRDSVEDKWAIVLRVIASAVAYVPVFGTAVAFVINTAVSLAQGEPISQALLDGVRGALPYQPASGMAFDFVVAVAKGKPVEEMLVAIAPLDKSVKDALVITVRIVRAVADGAKLTAIALNEMYAQLPPEGQKMMTIARAIADGKNIAQFVTDEANAAVVNAMQQVGQAAKEKGEEYVHRFIAESGYQGALDALPNEIKTALLKGLICGETVRKQEGVVAPPPPIKYLALGRVESRENARANDLFVTKGRTLIDAGITWRDPSQNDRKLSDIRDFSTQLWGRQTKVDEFWKRGFEIATGLCQGMVVNGPQQVAVRATLHIISLVNGFDAGQRIQHERTKQAQIKLGLSRLAYALGKANMPKRRVAVTQYA